MTKPDEYQRITIGYKEDTKRLGTGAATEQWCKTLFDAWMYSLDSETDRTSDETKRRLTALMRGNLNVRDALVASIIDPTLDVDAMLAIAVRPDDKSAKKLPVHPVQHDARRRDQRQGPVVRRTVRRGHRHAFRHGRNGLETVRRSAARRHRVRVLAGRSQKRRNPRIAGIGL